MSDASDDLDDWNRAAARYAALVGGPGDSFFRRFEPFLDRWTPAGGPRVLDLGCGHGWLAGRLAARGADVVGVDGSAALVARARADHPGLRFHVHDLTQGLPTSCSGPFDLVVSHMVLMDLPVLHPLLVAVKASLAPGGVLVVTILHPSFFHSEPIYDGQRHRRVTGYLDHETWLVESFGGHRHYHRPLAWYVQEFRRAGWVLADLDEPPTLPAHTAPSEEWTEDETWFSRLPTMLSLAARPAAGPEDATGGVLGP